MDGGGAGDGADSARLETVVADEVEARALGEVEHRRHREVWFTAADADPRLLDLRTADDLFLVVTVIDGVGHTRGDLAAFTRPGLLAALPGLLATRGRCGGADRVQGIDVAASFLGRRNYTRYDIEDAVGRQAAAVLGLPYHSRRDGASPPDGGLPLRVTVEGDQAVVAVRVADRPLHRRAYKQESTPGTLHPPLAAALARVAGLGPGTAERGAVLDPCCGTGTIPIEAAGLAPGLRLLGTDHDRGALAAAVANAARAGDPVAGAVSWAVADAGRMPVDSARLDRVVSNPPWGRQVEAAGALAGGLQRLFRETRRVLTGDGIAVLLLHEADRVVPLAVSAGLRVRGTFPVSLFGTHPSVVTLTR